MRWCSCGLAAALGVLLLGGVAAGQSQRPKPINVDVIVSHVYQTPAPPPPSLEVQRGLAPGASSAPSRVRDIEKRVAKMDDRVKGIDDALKGRFVYDQIDLVERHRMVLDVDEVGSVKLPNGKRFRVRPMDVAESGVLMAVDIGSKKLDVRATSGHLVVIGAEPYRDGQLVISVEPRY